MFLNSTSDVIKLTTGSAGDVDIHVSYADKDGTTITVGKQNTNVTSATTGNILSAPSSGIERAVEFVSIKNNDSSDQDIIVSIFDGTLTIELISATLSENETLQYSQGSWRVINAYGAIKQVTANTGVPVGSSTNVQYNNSGSFAAASKVKIDTNGGLTLSKDDSPATAGSSELTIFGREISHRMFLAQMGPSGLDSALQPLLARNKVGYWNPPGNATTVPGVFGFTAPTVVGTATARSVVTTNGATRMRRLGYVSAATAGSLTEQRVAVLQFSCGSGGNDGTGFHYIVRFVPSNAATVSGERFFIGLTNSTSAATNVEPSALTNCVGLAQLSSDNTQFYLVYGGSVAQTAIACGTGLGSPASLSTSAFELSIFAPNSIANTYYIQVTNIFTGATFTQTITGDATVCPQSTTLLAHKAFKTNNATALAVGFDICSIYMETDT